MKKQLNKTFFYVLKKNFSVSNYLKISLKITCHQSMKI